MPEVRKRSVKHHLTELAVRMHDYPVFLEFLIVLKEPVTDAANALDVMTAQNVPPKLPNKREGLGTGLARNRVSVGERIVRCSR